MAIARVEHTAEGCIIHLPEGFELRAEEVEVVVQGREIILREKHYRTDCVRPFDALAELGELLGEEPEDPPPEEREGL